MGALGAKRWGDGGGCDCCREEEEGGWGRVVAWVADENKHAAVESTKDGPGVERAIWSGVLAEDKSPA